MKVPEEGGSGFPPRSQISFEPSRHPRRRGTLPKTGVRGPPDHKKGSSHHATPGGAGHSPKKGGSGFPRPQKSFEPSRHPRRTRGTPRRRGVRGSPRPQKGSSHHATPGGAGHSPKKGVRGSPRSQKRFEPSRHQKKLRRTKDVRRSFFTFRRCKGIFGGQLLIFSSLEPTAQRAMVMRLLLAPVSMTRVSSLI